MAIEIMVGNITTCNDDAIVNAANEALLPGGGVCGAIHHAAGPELAAACRALGHCPTGNAVITPGFNLKAKHVIHAVGPKWQDGRHGENNLLAQCYQSIFTLVKDHRLKSVAIPAISTGIYGFPLQQATEIAVKMAKEFSAVAPDITIRFVCYSNDVAKIYREMMLGPSPFSSGQ